MGFIYHIFYYPAKMALWVYFKKITIHNRSRIPAKGPVLIASNHPNSFMEAVIAACHMSRVAHFIVRGDVFKNPVVAFMLRQTNQIPIFRFKDGFSNLKKNESTLEYCYRKLKQNQLIIIFSEGLCIQEKRLRPIQKGTARMAFGAYEEKGVSDLTIVPMGANYVDGTEARTTVMCSYGEPIYLKDYILMYNENPNVAIKKLTNDIEVALKKLVIHIDNPEYDNVVDFLLKMQANDFSEKSTSIVELNDLRLQRELKLVNLFNTFSEDYVQLIRKETEEYIALLEEKSLDDMVVSDRGRGNLIGSILGLILLLIPFGVGFITLSWMYYLANYATRKIVKTPEFITSVRYGVMAISYFFVSFLLILASIFFLNPIFLVGILIIPMVGLATFHFLDLFKKFIFQITWLRLEKDIQYELKRKRLKLTDIFYRQ